MSEPLSLFLEKCVPDIYEYFGLTYLCKRNNVEALWKSTPSLAEYSLTLPSPSIKPLTLSVQKRFKLVWLISCQQVTFLCLNDIINNPPQNVCHLNVLYNIFYTLERASQSLGTIFFSSLQSLTNLSDLGYMKAASGLCEKTYSGWCHFPWFLIPS